MTRQRVRTWAADAPAESSRFSSYWDRLPSTSCPSARHSFQNFQPPQRKYRAKASDGTRYALWEKVSFFAPFRYGVSCPEVHEVDLKPFAYAELCVPTTTVLSYAALFFTSSPEDSESQLRKYCDAPEIGFERVVVDLGILGHGDKHRVRPHCAGRCCSGWWRRCWPRRKSRRVRCPPRGCLR